MTSKQPDADWYEDPSGKYTHRYWDGTAWTGHVATNGVQSYDEPEEHPDDHDLEGRDVNLVAVERANVERDVAAWLIAVAKQVDRRLTLVQPRWDKASQPDAIRACAFGLLLGFLATEYPRARDQISLVAEVHPSFSTLREDYRLDTLMDLSREAHRAMAWLSPLVAIASVEQMELLYTDES